MQTGSGSYKTKRRWNISTLPNLICTLLLCLVCWYIGYYNSVGFPVRSNSSTSLLWNTVCGLLTDKDYIYFAGFTLLFLAAALLQRFNFHFVIFQGKTILPFLLFLLLNSVNPDFFPVRPVSIAIFPVFFAVFELFGSYQNPTATGRMFNMMFYLCACSLIWPFVLWFIPVFWIGMYQFRILNVQTFSASLLGFFTFFLFVFGWSIWKHDFVVFENIVQCLLDIHIVFYKGSLPTEWLKPVCFFIFMLALLFHVSSHISESSIRTRHFLSFLFMLGFFSFILSLLYTFAFVDFECVYYLSAAIIASYAFSGKHGIVSFVIYYLIIAVLIIFLLFRLWNFL